MLRTSAPLIGALGTTVCAPRCGEPKRRGNIMTDPMNALAGLQDALDASQVRLTACALYPELGVFLDQPNGKSRFTYALVNHGIVVAVALFAVAEPIKGLPCYNIGYAVTNSQRGLGIGSEVLRKAIEELAHGLSRTPMKAFYLEAVVSVDNEPSNRIATKTISDSPVAGTDCFSGEPILQYVRRVECGA